MLARCPACHTVFRVRSEQLRAHHGQVRCGSCLVPFDALDNLIEETVPPASSRSPEPAPDRSDRFFVLEDKAADTLSDQLDFELPDALVPQRATLRDSNERRQEPEEHTPAPTEPERPEPEPEGPIDEAARAPDLHTQGPFWRDTELGEEAEPAGEAAPDNGMRSSTSPDRIEPGIPTPLCPEEDLATEEPPPP
ncbi:MJ0042-type zinc finger domain-containing protein, partial [Aromatoleum petrolei]